MKFQFLRLMALALLIGLFLIPSASGQKQFGGFDIPRPDDLPSDIGDVVEGLGDIDDILANLPGFGLSMDEEEPITTSFDDAVYDCPFLDNYPMSTKDGLRQFIPTLALPRDAEGHTMVMPGRYETTIESFCLNAGTHGPGSGDGYLYAPLKGPWADIIQSVLHNYESHPEFEQRDIQYLVWALLARTNLNDMDPGIQNIARTLLSGDQINTINAGAFGIIPEDARSEIFNYLDLPPEVETVMASNADIRYLAGEAMGSYDELEAVAILAGNAPANQVEREVPAERWSYHREGYFIRYNPHGYSSTDVEIAMPDNFTIGFGDNGEVNSIEDEHGNRLEYDGANLIFTCPDSQDPWNTLEATWSGFTIRDADMRNFLPSHRSEVVRVVGDNESVDDIVKIGKFSYGVELFTLGSSTADSSLRDKAIDLGREAWMYAIIAANMSKVGESENKDLKPFDWRDRWSPFDPSGDTADPANRGCQRLGGCDPRPSQDPDWGDPDIPDFKPDQHPQANNAMEATDKFSDAADKLSWINDGPMSIVNSWGFAIPNQIFNEGLKWVVNLWEFCTGQISSDPPRSDYTVIAEPESITYYFLESPQDGPAYMVDAQNALMTSFLDVGMLLKAALISMERQSGAVAAGDSNWAWEQAKAFIYYERQSGYAMYIAADKIDAYIEVLRADGVIDVYINADDFSDAQSDLAQNGYSSTSLQAANTLGIPEWAIQGFLSRELEEDPGSAACSVIEASEELSSALRDYGNYLINLPDATQDNISGGDWLSVSP
ncbi:MAG: hypothetical protein NTY09_11320 [bacterium]|nr:hypothetical protein [bacterium]